MRGHRSQRGFTLTEMMVVVAMIAVLATMFIAVNGRAAGSNANTLAEQVAGTLQLARTRAVASRRIQRVEVHLELTPPELRVWQARNAGMKLSNINTADFIERVRIPRSVTLWAAVVGAQAAGANPAQTTTQFDIDILPDGTATAATLYFTDVAQSRKGRVLVYHVTGSSYARPTW
jgi:prepilin-type N-terminal cleavage/methylation domain-containing protein